MTQFFSTARDAFGNVVPEATITVADAGTENLRDIFVDNAQSLAKLNPFTADENGFFNFFTDPGNVKIKVEKSGFPTSEIDFVPVAVTTLSGSQVGGRIILSGVQSINDSANLQVLFDTQVFDNGGCVDLGNNQLVAPVAGTYVITTGIRWAANATGVRLVQFVQGVSFDMISAFDQRNGASSQETSQVISEVFQVSSVNAPATIAVNVLQTSGGALNIGAGASTPTFASIGLLYEV